MRHKRPNVATLAKEANLDIEDTLIILWDAGLNDLGGPNDIIKKRAANKVRRALGIATRRELASQEYWRELFQLSPEEFKTLLLELGHENTKEDRKLSKKIIYRLKEEYKRKQANQRKLPPEKPIQIEKRIEEFIWETIGHEYQLKHLTTSQIREIHEVLVEDHQSGPDPIVPSGVRSDDLLDSAAHRPLTSIGSTQKYPTIEMAAAALLHSLVHDHAFHNGNKRTALVAMLVFLDENGLVLTCDEEALFKLVLQLAQHSLVREKSEYLADREVLAVARWLQQNSRWIKRGDRALPWRRLQRILTDLGCNFDIPSSAGSKMNIYRKVCRKGSFLRKDRWETLSTQTCYQGNGREIAKNAINKIRHDLELTEEHGIDSAKFYDNAPATASEFIVKYSKIIRKLAKL